MWRIEIQNGLLILPEGTSSYMNGEDVIMSSCLAKAVAQSHTISPRTDLEQSFSTEPTEVDGSGEATRLIGQ